MHLARLRGAQRPARKSGAFKGGPQGTAKRHGVGREPKATETSGLEGDARAGISTKIEAASVGFLFETNIKRATAPLRKTRSRPSTGRSRVLNDQDLAHNHAAEKGYGLHPVK